MVSEPRLESSPEMGDKIIPAAEVKEAGGALVVQRVIRESGGSWPMLTRTNYADWALLMQVMLEARQLWVAVKDGTPERETDRAAMEYLLRSVPPEMISTLAVKPTAKEAWEALEKMRLGVTRVRDARATALKKQLEAIKFNDSEDLDDFSMRLSSLVSQLGVLGVQIKEPDTVRKFLSVVPKQFSQMACSIETLLDLDTLSIEELIGRLKAAEERYSVDEPSPAKATGKLLLSEQDWFARMKLRDGGSSSSHAGRGGGKPRGRGTGYSAPGAGRSGESRDSCRYCGVAGHWARDCRKKKKGEEKKREEEAHLVQTGEEDDDDALLMMSACTIASAPLLQAPTACKQPGISEATTSTRLVAESSTRPVAEPEDKSTPPNEFTRIQWIAEWDEATLEESTASSREDSTKVTREESALSTLHELVESPGQEDPTTSSQEDSTRLSQEDSTRATRKESVLFLREEKAQVNLAQEGDTKKGVWYLDSGATNHMTGDRAAFAELDPSIVGTVKFGDGSRVNICGQGTVLFICKTGEHRAITGVYYIPRLNTQILSLGQFDENGCQILIKDGILRLRDRERKLLVKVEREPNRMYKLAVRVAQPVCLAVHAGSEIGRASCREKCLRLCRSRWSPYH